MGHSDTEQMMIRIVPDYILVQIPRRKVGCLESLDEVVECFHLLFRVPAEASEIARLGVFI